MREWAISCCCCCYCHAVAVVVSENIPIEGADNAEVERGFGGFGSHCLLLLMLLLFVLMFLVLGFGDIEFDCCEHWIRHAKSSQNQPCCCCLRQRDNRSGLIT
jgi:hypothetical protein